MRAWIFGAAETTVEDAIFYRRLRFGKDDLIICADGGYDTASMLGVTPSIVIGDMDSLKGRIPADIRKIVYPVKKDKTDMDLCVDYALQCGCTEVILLCAFGGRIDHSIAAFITLARITQSGAEGMLLTKHSKMFMIKDRAVIKRGEYSKISLIPVTETVSGVTTEGLQYSLQNAQLRRTDNLGISNSFCGNEASVEIEAGILCIVCEID